MAFFIQCKFIKSNTVFRLFIISIGFKHCVFSLEQSLNSQKCQKKTWAPLTSFFHYQALFTNTGQITRLERLTVAQKPTFRSIHLEQRSWKITIKSHFIDWQMIKFTEKNIENSTYRQWKDQNNHLYGDKLLIFKYDPTGFNNPETFRGGPTPLVFKTAHYINTF